jgi:hypothetical protein
MPTQSYLIGPAKRAHSKVEVRVHYDFIFANTLASPSSMREYAPCVLSYHFWYVGRYCGDFIVVVPLGTAYMVRTWFGDYVSCRDRRGPTTSAWVPSLRVRLV